MHVRTGKIRAIGRACGVPLVLLLALAGPATAGFLDDVVKALGLSGQAAGIGDADVVAGLKEALSIGTANAVDATSAVDGYFANAAIRIVVPENMRKAADVLGKVGFRKEVDDFERSMNRAAERAAPRAREIFIDAVRGMTFEDARGILKGGDTAATDYFRSKTREKIRSAFAPVVSASMDEVGVTRSYKELMGRYAALPFVDAESVDLDRYVTGKALDGLFLVLGQEETKIRKDPAARVTDLLKKVFGAK